MRMLKLGGDVAPSLEHLNRGAQEVLVVHHVRARHQDDLRGHIVVFGHQQTALTRVDVLVGLCAVTADAPKRAGVTPVPARAHGVGAVLHQSQAMSLAYRHHGVHVGDVPAHVRE
jgi:hypothetical protein